MTKSYLIVRDDELATIRITKAVLDNFKSVAHGEIVFDCGQHDVPAGTRSDILGLYGQNGSGKTSLIEALRILKDLASGRKVPDEYAECIAADADCAHLGFEFDYQYPSGRRLRVGYDVCLRAEKKPAENVEDLVFGPLNFTSQYCVRICNEIVSMGGLLNGKDKQYQPCIDTTDASPVPFGPESRHNEFFSGTEAAKEELYKNRIIATERSLSFIFMEDSMNIFFFQDVLNASEYFQALAELRNFAKNNLFVIDSRAPIPGSNPAIMPLYTMIGALPVPATGSAILPIDIVEELNSAFVSINAVLDELIPGLNISVKSHGSTMLDSKTEGTTVTFVSIRNGVEYPLRAEAEGIKKLISILMLFTFAFDHDSATVAIDELDAGIFEYLLGELLKLFEESGSGQLIFTSHNLRPLEVLSNDAIWFTTTNPENRYYHIKRLGTTNNLRDVYYREILIGEQDEELYSASKKYKVISALRKATTKQGGE